MSGSSRNLAQLPSTIFKTYSERIYGDAAAAEPPGRDDDVIIRNAIGHDNQDLLSSGVGVGLEQVPGSSSDCQTGTGSAVDIRDLLNSIHDLPSGIVGVKLEHWFRSAGKHDNADMSPVSGNNKASRHFLDEVFEALVVASSVHLYTTRSVHKEANIDLSFAHCEEMEVRE